MNLRVSRLRAPFLTPILFSAFLIGCGKKDSVDIPEFDPEGLAAKAMTAFDSNSDGNLDADELDQCPGVKAALSQLDSDNNQQVSATEIAARVQSWLDSSTGGLPAAIQVTYKGKPLAGADVVFEPEPFLDGVIFPAKGVTSASGRSELACSKLPFGAQAGFYRVKFTSPDQTIPAKYNTATEIGAEVSNESSGIVRGRFQFDLK